MAAYRPKLSSKKPQFVVAVGARVYVHWSPPTGQPACPVPMLNGAGQLMTNDLTDGQEVEVLSWRPHSRDGLAYQIRRLSDASEWWIASTYLRRMRVRQAEALTPDPPAEAMVEKP